MPSSADQQEASAAAMTATARTSSVDTEAATQVTSHLPRVPSSASVASDGTGYQSTFSHMTAGTIATLATGLHHTKTQWRILAAGQVLSLIMVAYNAANSSITFDCGVNAPAFQILPLYFIMSMHAFSLWFGCGGGGNGRTAKNEQSSAIAADASNTANNKKRVGFGVRFLRRRGGNNDASADEGDDSDNDTKNDGDGPAPKYYLFRRWKLLPLHTAPSFYLILAFCDVQANYLTYLALRYTTINAVTLFDSLAIPAAMVLTRCWLRRRYHFTHVVGACICMAGTLANIGGEWESLQADEVTEERIEAKEAKMGIISMGAEEEAVWEQNLDNEIYPNRIVGDVMAALGGILLGVCDVMRENVVHGPGGFSEYVTMLGLFGTIISVIQAFALEYDEIVKFFAPVPAEDIAADGTIIDGCPVNRRVGLLAGYVTASYFFYIGVSRFLYVSEAALLNLSLLTCDLWTTIFVVMVQGIVPDPLFYTGLALITFGVVVYEIAPSPAEPGDFAKPTDFTISACMGAGYSEDEQYHDPRQVEGGDFEPTGWDDSVAASESEITEHAGIKSGAMLT
mmetsp:Transcript_23895/g.68636  ORF Transcript_23895/g.68636 Transcript_23895/m.68636 type:complete len:568 (-) Transcript_23895:64-1767(-)